MRWPGGNNEILIRAKQSLRGLLSNGQPPPASLGQDEDIVVLAIMPARQDRKMLEETARSQRWRLLTTQGWTESFVMLDKHTPSIVLLNRNSLGIDWRDLLHFLLLPKHLCCIVLTTEATADRFCEQFLADMSVAPKNGPIMAGREGPAMWLRNGQPSVARRPR